MNRIKKQDHSQKNKSNLFIEYLPIEKKSGVARVAIMGNTYAKIKGNEDLLSVNFPVGARKTVRFANSQEIMFALGIPEMENPIPVGMIKTTNGLKVHLLNWK